jgi:hypothetical protein
MKYALELTSSEVGFCLSSAREALKASTDPKETSGLRELVAKLESAEPEEHFDAGQFVLPAREREDGTLEVTGRYVDPEDVAAMKRALPNPFAGPSLAEADAPIDTEREKQRMKRQRLHDHGAGGCQARLKESGLECINPQCGWRYRL